MDWKQGSNTGNGFALDGKKEGHGRVVRGSEVEKEKNVRACVCISMSERHGGF